MKDDKGGIAIGGGFMIGLGVGFFLLKYYALYFVGSIIAGIGLGLIVASIINK